MPATGPGVARVKASVASSRTCQVREYRLIQARTQARTAVTVAAQAASIRLVWIGSQLSAAAKPSVPSRPASDQAGG